MATQTGNVYLDPSFTTAINGTTHGVTGEELEFGVNAFNNFNLVNSMLVPGSTLFLNGDVYNDSLFTSVPVNVVATDITVQGCVFGYRTDENNPAGRTREGDFTVYAEGCTFTWFTSFAGQGSFDSHQTLIVANRVYNDPDDPESGYTYVDGTYNLTFKNGTHNTNSFYIANYANISGGTVNVTFEDYRMNGDLWLFKKVYNNEGESLKEVNLVLTNVQAPAAKWMSIWDPNEANDTKLTLTVTDSVFIGSDHTLGFIGEMNNGSWSGEGEIYISGFTSEGRLSGARGTGSGDATGITGTRTLTVEGKNNISLVRDFTRIEIAAGASLTATDINNIESITVAGQLNATNYKNVGELHFLSGSVLRASQTNFKSVSNLTFDSGVSLLFDLSGKEPGTITVFNSFSAFQGVPDITIAVSDVQNNGSYVLATGTPEMIGTITLANADGNPLGQFASVDDAVEIGERTYTLNCTNGVLSLEITGVISGQILENEERQANSNTTYADTTLNNGGKLVVKAGGRADNTVVNSGGSLSIERDGTANGVNVSSGGRVSIDSGTVNDIILNSNATLHCNTSATINNITVGVGGYYYASGVSITNLTISSGGTATISNVKSLNGVTINSGASFSCYGGNTIQNVIVNDGYNGYLSPAVTISGLTLNAGGRMRIQSGAAVFDVVENGGAVDVLSGGTATFQSNAFSGVIVNSSRYATVHSGTTATSTTVSSGGSMQIFSSGIADGVVVSRGGYLSIDRRTSVTGVKVMNSGTLEMTLDSGTNISGTYGGSAFAAENGGIDGYGVNRQKRLQVLDGGSAGNTVVSSGGTFFVGPDGMADGTTVNSGGEFYVSSGGKVSNTVAAGRMTVSSGATATELITSGHLSIEGGATVTALTLENGWFDLTVDDKTYVSGTLNGSAFEVKDGQLNDYTTIGGSLHVGSGGLVNNLTINDVTGLHIDGGTVNGMTSYYLGCGVFINGGLLTGRISVSDTITIENNGAILFAVSDITPDSDEPLLRRYRLEGSINLKATVSDAQMQGSYVLAHEASGFNSYISVYTEDGTFLEELNLVDNTIEYAGRTYTLRLNGEALMLDVEETDCPVITLTGDNTTPLRSSTLTASSDPGVNIYFSTDNKNWSLYAGEISVNENTTYYFKGTAGGGGNIGTNWISFTNIDTIPPEAPTASASITVNTLGNVTVTASFSEDSAVREYSLDGENWQPYDSGVVFSENGTVYFRGADEAGNLSDVTRYDVTNIVNDDFHRYAFVDPMFGANGEGIAEGATHSITGIPLVWGVNAFSRMEDACAVAIPGQNVYVSHLIGENLTTNDQLFNLHISGSTVPVMITGFTSGDKTYVGDVTLTIENSTIATQSGSYLVGTVTGWGENWLHNEHIIGDLTINVVGSTIGGNTGAIRVTGFNFVDVLGTEDDPATITFNFKDSIIRDDFLFIGDSPLGLEETFQGVTYKGANLVINFDNVLVPNDKWWYIQDGNWKSEGTIKVNIKDSTIGGGDSQMRFSLGGWQTAYGSPQVCHSDISFTIENSTIVGYLQSASSFDGNHEELSAFDGKKSVTLVGDNSIRYIYWFDEINLTPGATLTGRSIRMASAGGKINIDVTGYTGSSKVLVAMDYAFENIGAEDISITGVENSVYQILCTDRLIILKGNDSFKDLYVNPDYTSMDVVLGTSCNGEALFYGENAFASVSDAIPYLTDGTVLHLTGGEHSLNSGVLSNNSILIDACARLTMNSDGAAPITVNGDLVNNGTVVISTAGFIEDPQLDRIVLTADSISGNGTFETDNEHYSIELVGNEVHLLQKTYDVSMCSDWIGRGYGDYISYWASGGVYIPSRTFGVDAFATIEDAERAASILGTLTVIDSDVTFTKPIKHNVNGVGSRTIIRNAHVTGGNTLSVMNEATVMASNLEIDEGATVFFQNGGTTLVYDVNSMTPRGESKLDLSRVTGYPIWQINVSPVQDLGEYVLATNAGGRYTGFGLSVDGSYAVPITSMDYESGIYTQAGNRLYSLTVDDEDRLILYCSTDVEAPVLVSLYANTTEVTNQPVYVSAEFSDNYKLEKISYRIGDGSWMDYNGYGVTVSGNSVVYFKATDSFGNESEIAGYTVSNIVHYTSSGVVLPYDNGYNGDVVNPGRFFWDVTVNPEGSFRVMAGGTATEIRENGGFVDYEDGAIVTFVPNTFSGVTISQWGYRATVHSLTTAEDTVLKNGQLIVFSGGSAVRTTVSGGSVIISSGGIADSAFVSTGGEFAVYSGGTATNVSAAGDAKLVLDIASDTYIGGSYGRSAFEMKDGVLSGLKLNAGSFTVLSGGTAEKTTFGGKLSNYCQVIVSSGGLVDSLTIATSGHVIVSSGATACNTIGDGGTLVIESGGSIFNVSTPGFLVLGIKGEASGITMSRGRFDVATTGSVTDVNLFDTGGHSIEGYVENLVASATDYIQIEVGGSIHHFSVGNNVLVINSGSISDATIESGGKVFNWECSKEYNISNVRINSGGLFYLGSHGSAADITVSQGGECTITVVPNTYFSGTGGDGTSFEMYDGIISGCTIPEGYYVEVFSDGIIENTTIDSFVQIFIYKDGLASNTIIKENAVLRVSSGGTALDIKENGGYVEAKENAVISFAPHSFSGAQVRATSATIHSGTTANSMSVRGSANDGVLFVYSGGTANHTTLSRNAYLMLSGGEVNDTVLKQSSFLMLSSGTANGTVVSYGGEFIVSSGGMANDTNVSRMGNLTVLSGGKAVRTCTSEIDARVSVEAGASISSTTINGGNVVISAGARADGVEVNAGKLTVLSNGKATEIKENGGFVDAYDLANVSFASNSFSGLRLDGSSATIHSGTTANDIVIRGDDQAVPGKLFVFSGGSVNDTTLGNGGVMNVSSGGTASNVTISSGGSLHVFNATALSDVMVEENGQVTVENGVSISGATVKNNGSLVIGNGVTLTGFEVKSNAKLTIRVDRESVIEGTIAGNALEARNGLVHDCTFDLADQHLCLDNGVVATNITIGNNAYLEVNGSTVNGLTTGNSDWHIYFSNALLTGKIDTYGLNIYEDSTIDINISELTPDADTTRIGEGVAYFLGRPQLVLTVSKEQMQGTYILSKGKWINSFNTVSLTVKDESGSDLGVLSQNQSFTLAGKQYTLRRSGTTLSLDVKTIKPVIKLTTDNTTPLQSTTLSASVQSGLDIYVSCDNRTWSKYEETISVTENATYFFKAIDEKGNIGTNWISFRNIDTVAPEKPTVSANMTHLTNRDVVLYAEFSEDSFVKEYSFDGENWMSYTGSVTCAENGNVYFRSADEAGNISEITTFTVDNIDKIPPADPAASASTTEPTGDEVVVTAVFSEDSETKEYSLDGEHWNQYTEEGIRFQKNGTVYFRAADSLGNVSQPVAYIVNNIYNAPPVIRLTGDNTTILQSSTLAAETEYGVSLFYSTDNENWIKYEGKIAVNDNGTYYFKAIDPMGHTETANIVFNNIDKSAPVIANAELSQGSDDYSFAAAISAVDDRTTAADLKYFIRYADSVSALPGTPPVDGLCFSMTPDDIGKTLYYQVGAEDAAGNIAWSEAKAFVVGDRTAPILNGQPQAEFKNRMVFVTWEPASDNVAVAGYRLTFNDAVYELHEPGFVLENVEAGTYNYQVMAFDEAGNETSSDVQTLEVTPRADLSIQSVQVIKGDRSATTISTQDKVTLSIKIGNIGGINAPMTVASIYCGILHLTDIAVAAIMVGDTKECTYVIEAGRMSTGIQNIRVEVDPEGKILEYSELNNVRSLTLNVENTSLSDLVIGSIGLDRTIYSAEDNAVLTFTVRNIGYSKAASASKVYIYDGDAFLGSMDVEALEADAETGALSYTIEAGRLTPGNHTVRIVADGEKIVSETNEENNGAQIQLTVGQCDLGVSKLSLSQEVCNTEEAVTLNFTVRNGGTDKAAASFAGIYDGDTLLGTVEIGELSRGLSVSKQFVIAAGSLSVGEHNLRVVADATKLVSESDEDNNSRGAVLSVFQKDDDAPEFAEVMIRQGDNDYVFEVSAVAFDNITFDEDIVYGVRFAETKAGLEEAEILEGTEFSLTPEYAGKTMYYQVSATDLAGNTRWCVARPFTVKDRTAPEIGNIMVSTTGSVLRLNWEASDNIAVTSYKVYCDGELVSTQEAASFTQDGVSVGSHIYRVEALDAAGNVSTTGNIKVNFDDTIAPEIESVSAEQSADGYDIAFAVTATDNETQSADIVNRVQYAFAAEDVANAPLSDLNLALAPADAGRTLYYRVSAVDEAGNTVWTDIHSLVIADRTAPDAPADLNGSVHGSGATLNWTSSSDNVGVAGYQVRYGATESLGGDGVLVEGNQYELTALKEGVYYWQTAAFDAAGNVSEWSEVKSFRILPDDAFGANGTAEQAYDLGALSGEHTLAGGAISSADDEGWFKFTLDAKGTANDFIQIAFDNREGDLDLYLYSANGTTLLQASDGTTGDMEKISLKDLQKGTYLLKVVGKNGAMNTFSISTKKVAGYDMDVYDANGRNDSLEAATVFDIEKTPQATVSGLNLHESGDVDFYQLTLTNMGLEGDGVSISFENSVGDLDLVLYDSKGVKVSESAGTANVESVSFNGLAAGSYYVQVVAAHNAVNEYTLNWNFASNKVEADALEGQEPYAITESTELANLSISATDDGVTQEDTFTLTLNQPGSATSKIRFSNYRSDWNGLKYVVKDSTDAVVLSGIGSEISLDGLEAGDYSLTVDTPVAGSFSSYDISVSLPESAGTKWTYMVYMAADSNLDTYALYDLIAMQQANLDSQIDIYVLVDRSETSAYELPSLAARNKWDSAWSDTRVGKITYNPGSTVSVDWESWGELDTSSIATLRQFVDWAQDQSMSENYGLIMWDHGMEDGSLCVDGTTDADWGTSLSISEVSAFLAEKGNIPLVIFNNCLLGSELVATQMTGSTDVIVVSEAESHPQNSTYAYKDFFSTITADMTAEEMAKVLVQNVRQYGDGSQPSMLSAVDVTDSRLAEALEELAEAVSSGNNNDKTALINGMLKTLQDGCAYAGSTVYQSDLYDMIVQTMGDRHYANASNGFKAALADLKSVLEDVVLVSRSVPENRGYGIATFNPVLTVKTYAAAGYSASKVSELIQSYLDANYAANPAWAGLLSDLVKTYQTQYSSSIKSASFSVSSIVDIGKDELVSSMDLGCFSGHGEVIDGISLLGDLYLGVTITSGATSTGAFSVANDMNIDVTVTILASDGSFVASGVNSVNFSDLAVGDYYILLQSDDDCAVTLSFEANWTTGVDRFDYAQSKVNEKLANGNGSIAKASALAAGYYSGLLTYQGDTDWYQIGNVYTEKYKVVLEGAAGMTVAEYDAEGKLVQTAKYANGKYMMTVKAMNYLFVEGSADLYQDQVNAYSVDISGVQAGAEEEEDMIPPEAPVASADVTTATNGNVTVSAVFSDDSVVKEYSLDGENWQAYPEGGVIIIINGTVSFRAFDEAGNGSKVTDFLVSNIDKTAPTAPSGLQAAVADQTVTLSWASSTDDLAGVKEYVVKYSHDGQEFTLTTAGTSLVLENMDFATWQWSVTAFDAVGNASEATAGEAFTVEQAVGPELKKFNLFTGRFAGGSQAMLANEDKGVVTIYANGTVWGTELVLDPGWKIAGVGDFDANGQDDFLRVNSEGYVVGEKTQTNGMFEVQVLNFRNAGWSILGTGDFNGNGSDDVLIANPTAASDTVGLLGYWESGVTWTLINGYSAEWEMIATGDYNADGKCDMLWRNSFVGEGGLTYNAFCTWIVEDPVDWRMVSVANPAEWNFLCAGDFNGDGANDIAMINDVGVVGIWGVEDGWLSSWSILSAVDTSAWTLAGVGDFNADGTDDIAWVNNASGMAGYWQIEDKNLASWQNIATIS